MTDSIGKRLSVKDANAKEKDNYSNQYDGGIRLIHAESYYSDSDIENEGR